MTTGPLVPPHAGPAGATPPPGATVHVGVKNLAHNPKALLGIGAAGVLLIVLWRKHAAASSTTSTTSTTTGILPASTGSGSGSTASGSGTYDSTASDVYNGIQPEIDALNAQLGALQTGLASGTPTGSGGSTATYTGNAYLVSDQADEQIALADGVPLANLFYAGSDPNAGVAGNGYGAPTDLPTWLSSMGGSPVYVGLAGKVAPTGAVTAEGATRVQTNQLLQQLLAANPPGQSAAAAQAAASTPAAPSIPSTPYAPPRTINTSVIGGGVAGGAAAAATK